MGIVLALSRAILSALFIFAAVAKFLNRSDTVEAIVGFGVRKRWSEPLAIALPFVEGGIAVLLLLETTEWWGAAGAFCLLALFTAAIGWAMATGRRPACNCFGQLNKTPIGTSTLLRNLAFMGLSAFVIWSPEGDTGSTIFQQFENRPYEVLFVAVLGGVTLVAAWIIFHLLRQQGRMLVLLDNLEARLNSAGIPAFGSNGTADPRADLQMGTDAPPFELPGVSGAFLSLDSLTNRGKPLLLIFSDPQCSPCNALLLELADWRRHHRSELTMVVISRGDVATNVRKAEEWGIADLLLQVDREVAEAYRLVATPSAVLIGTDGKIAAPSAVGSRAIVALANRATTRWNSASIGASRNAHYTSVQDSPGDGMLGLRP